MRESLSSLLRPEAAPSFPPFDRLAPPPPLNLLGAQIDALTSAGDIVIDLHGRGGWVAHAAVQRLRRAWSFESNRLTRLLAEVVLRPPDLRHLDAAVQSMAVSVRQERPLKGSIEALFASRCATCERAVTVEEFVWDGDGGEPIRKTYRCAYCRDQVGGGDVRHAPTSEEDRRRAAETPDGHDLAVAELRGRFPVIAGHEDLADQLLALYTPRSLVSLHAILQRIEGDLRAASIEAALRLAFLHALLPASRLSGFPGRQAGLRISGGKVRPPTSRQWRERDPWLVFEEGLRLVRGFVQRLEASPGGRVQARPGDHPLGLADGTANVVVQTGPPDGGAADGARPATGIPRVRLVLSQPPLRWGVEAISHAYLASALALGREAAAEIDVSGLLGGSAPRLSWSGSSGALRRSLAAVRPLLAPDAEVLVILDPGGAEPLVAAALAGVGAGLRLTDAQLAESDEGVGGMLSFAVPGDVAPRRPRTRANVPLPPLAAHASGDGPFQLAEVERDVGELAVALLRSRGEPARYERLLGQILVGLDAAGHLRRLVGTRTFQEQEAPQPGRPPERGDLPDPGGTHERGPEADAHGPRGERYHAREASPAAPGQAGWFGGVSRRRAGGQTREAGRSDQVSMLLELIDGELRRPGLRRLAEIEPGHWWLTAQRDLGEAAIPLADRVEWAVFSLLTTSGRLSEAALYERVATMFRGSDSPDAALVQACLDSYRSIASTPDELRTNEELQARHAQHTAILGDIVDYGHRLGLRVWVRRSEQVRQLDGRPLGLRLDEQERRAYLPLVLHAPVDALENIDAIWYLRGRITILFEVEWTAMLGETILRRGGRIPQLGDLVRFLVIVPERTGLVRFKLARSAVLREAIEAGNWYILKSDHLRRLVQREGADLERLKPLLGLDPEIETAGEQLPLFLSAEPSPEAPVSTRSTEA